LPARLGSAADRLMPSEEPSENLHLHDECAA
jgi:hypothetical protein